MSEYLEQAQRIADRAVNRALGMVRRGLLTLVDASYRHQMDADDATERYDDAESWQHYGFASLPPKGTEVIAVLVRGMGESAVIVAEQHRGDRPVLAAGEVAIYAAKGICKVKPDGTIELVAGSGKLAHLGGIGGEALHKGATFDTAHKLMLDAIKKALNTIGTGINIGTAHTAGAVVPTDPTVKTDSKAAADAIGVFTGAQSGRLTTKSKAE